jgi:hypothetical protein
MPDRILKRMHAGRPGISRIEILDPVDTRGLTPADMEDLKKKVYALMDECLRKHHIYN